MLIKSKKVKKLQRTVHMIEEVDQEIIRRTQVSDRGYSAELNYICKKYFAMIADSNKKAVDMSKGSDRIQRTEHQSPVMDE